jgi:hypothetical protein
MWNEIIYKGVHIFNIINGFKYFTIVKIPKNIKGLLFYLIYILAC